MVTIFVVVMIGVRGLLIMTLLTLSDMLYSPLLEDVD